MRFRRWGVARRKDSASAACTALYTNWLLSELHAHSRRHFCRRCASRAHLLRRLQLCPGVHSRVAASCRPGPLTPPHMPQVRTCCGIMGLTSCCWAAAAAAAARRHAASSCRPLRDAARRRRSQRGMPTPPPRMVEHRRSTRTELNISVSLCLHSVSPHYGPSFEARCRGGFSGSGAEATAAARVCAACE